MKSSLMPARMLAVLICVAALTTSATVASAQSRTSAVKAGSTPQPYLVFTHNGIPIGSPQTAPCPVTGAPCANDVHFVWKRGVCRNGSEYPPVTVVWTQYGVVVGSAQAPCKSNDFEFTWNEANQIKIGSWTSDGQPFARVLPPQGTNDAHVYWSKGSVVKAWWTLDGKPTSAIKVPEGANDVHWYDYPPTSGAPSLVYLTHNGKVVGEPSKAPCIANTAGAVMCANDLHLVWRPGPCRGNYQIPPVVLAWTVNGRLDPTTAPEVAPCRVNDFEFNWDANNDVLSASWTYNGQPVAWITPPRGANDAHVFWYGDGRLLKAYWTLNSKPIENSNVPAGVNDFHWFGELSTYGDRQAEAVGFQGPAPPRRGASSVAWLKAIL